jgi:hypothetical protein
VRILAALRRFWLNRVSRFAYNFNMSISNEVHRVNHRLESASGRKTKIEGFERAGAMSASILTIDDLAEAIADAVKSSERRILAHLVRRLKLVDFKLEDPAAKRRITNIHRRLIEVESELRRARS